MLYLAALAVGTYLAFRPTLDSGFARVAGDPGDTMLNHYLLEHSRRALFDPEYCGTLLSPPFFHPTPLVLGYSENMLGVAPLYWGLRSFLPEVPAFQVWMIVLNGLNLLAFACAARWLGAGPLTALLGGYLWAFGLVHIDQIKHAQLIPRFWMPLALYHAIYFLTAPNPRSLNRLCACVFLQCATCVYTGWFLAVGLAVFMPVAAILNRSHVKEMRFSARAWGIVCGWALVMGLFFAPYFLANRGVSRSYSDCLAGMPTVHSWLTAAEGGCWTGSLKSHLPKVNGESRLFCGFMLLALVAGAAIWSWGTIRVSVRRRDAVWIASLLLTAGFWWLVTLRFGDSASGWWLVRYVPGGQAIRCVSRVYVIVYLFASMGAVLWLEEMLQRFQSTPVRLLVLVAVGVAVVYEQSGHTPLSFVANDYYPVAERCGESLQGADAGYVKPTYGAIPGTHGELIGMWAGLHANVPVVNGYSGRWPVDYPVGYVFNERLMHEWLDGHFQGRVALVDPARPGEVQWVLIENGHDTGSDCKSNP